MRGGGKVFVVLAGIGLLATGCATKAPPRPVSLTAAVTQTRAQTAKLSISTSVQTGGMTMTFTETGAFDFAHARGTLSMQAPVDMTLLFLSPHMYMKMPSGEGTSLPAGKSWVDFDAASLAGAGGASASAMAGVLGTPFTGDSNPGDLLASLTAISGSVKKLGPETVRGVPVTGFQVNVDIAKAAASLPSAERSGFQDAMGELGTREIPVDVWVDGQNLVRRTRMTLHPSVSAASVPDVTYTETTDFFDFGAPVRVTAPPASQVASMAQLGKSVTSSGSGSSAAGTFGGPATPPNESGSLSPSQVTSAEQAVRAFWSAIARGDQNAVAQTVLPAQRGCVTSGMGGIGDGMPKITVSGLNITSGRPAGTGKATVRFTVTANASLGGQTVPVLPAGPGTGQWLVAAESAGHWYVDLNGNSDLLFGGC